ncbi:MAG: D-alanyl-D-alanine carboxypeptidase/D-alanyl-D-alanine-endopeptidase [Desulfuromonadaceae bacterium]|nr:D-alanyl-D-alanine carboxypeptidase/D-alanyl-D-alanine-endopeptidase [Desulfuromonadaceae bacterium]MDD2849244.1 D-alanyl-D-alanine carboxypeptidase/D-alanyl-D-alanine-endopeptidase [Desulfuromonadaceae bacterium]MDD4131871.1 D-alanyl-D-alanine carboxypeptidase/D-alanyl-D-alanine-endopeptidase [Desulfuromonadaceae bacterium]
MKLLLVIAFLVLMPCVAFASPPQAERLTQRLTELLPSDARWGVTVLELKNGKEIITAGNVDEPLAPASLVKLITAGAALERKTDAKPLVLTTEILHDGTREGSTLNGSIYLYGNGNCLLTTNDLKQAAQALRDTGITIITGGVVADATGFDARGLERTRGGAGHAPVSALGIDLHTVSVSATPAEEGQSPRVTIEPPNDQVRFAVAARTVSGGRNSLTISQNDDNGYRISGTIPGDAAPDRRRFPLANPARYAAQSFRSILIQTGIKVKGEATTGRTPNDAAILATIPGPSTEQLVREMNTNSLNVAADNLLLAMVSHPDGSPSTRDQGVAVINSHLARHGISSEEAHIVDGSGLLPANYITVSALARYLAAVSHQPWFCDLRDSLPRSGLDGTLRNGSFKNERFRAKSGSLENVVSLAGYGVDKNGREIAFAFIANTPGPLPPNAVRAGDEVMRFLAE